MVLVDANLGLWPVAARCRGGRCAGRSLPSMIAGRSLPSMLIRVAIDGCCDGRVLDLPMGWPTLAVGIKESGFGVVRQAAFIIGVLCCRLDQMGLRAA
ncbi:hypothetical protein ACLOJK_014994 [Asimina triloba]